MTVFVFLAEGFEEIEAISAVDIFRRAEINTTTISISNCKSVTGAHGITILADKTFDEANFSDASLLYLPGGMPGTKNLALHEGLRQIIIEHFKQNKLIAAICAAPSILGEMGLLAGKDSVCYPGLENKLQGAILSDKKIVNSGLIYTAKGAGVTVEFALKLVEKLKGVDKAQKISNSICL